MGPGREEFGWALVLSREGRELRARPGNKEIKKEKERMAGGFGLWLGWASPRAQGEKGQAGMANELAERGK